MLLTFPLLLLVAALLCWPVWRVSRRRGAESRWLPVAALPATLLWIGLAAAGFGPQSLSNLVEPLGLVAASVPLVYAKVWLVDPRIGRPARTTYALVVLLLLAALLLRAWMPLLPE